MEENEKNIPSVSELENELQWELNKVERNHTVCKYLASIIVFFAIIIIVMTYFVPTFRIYGTSMEPAFADGEIVVTMKRSEYEEGDVVAFYYYDKVMIKRIVATEDDIVVIDRNGQVYVNDSYLKEPYVSNKSYEPCDIEIPCEIPEGKYFLLGDNRAESVDSRRSTIGFVSDTQIIGKIVFRICPLNKMAFIK